MFSAAAFARSLILPVWGVAIFTALLCTASEAQIGIGPMLESPGDTRPPLPNFEPPTRERGTLLPSIELSAEPDTEGLAAGVEIFVRAIRVTGYTVLSDAEVDAITAPYTGRYLTFAKITALRNEFNRAYIERGFVSSGAEIPDQRMEDGVLEIDLIEGTLESIEVETDGRLRAGFLRRRLELAARGPPNIFALEEALQILQLDPGIRRLEAQLEAGETRGTSKLRVSVKEARPYWALLEGSNYQAPSIGSGRGEIRTGYRSLAGIGDELSIGFRGTAGLLDLQLRYVTPLNRYGTTLDILVKAAFSKVVEDSLEALDIKSDAQTAGLTLEHPVYRSLQTRLALFATGQFRRSKSSLLGRGFSFAPGCVEGECRIAVLRFGTDWVYSDRVQVLAFRSTFNFGLDILGATSNSGEIPDGRFFYWLGQAQWARRFRFLDVQLLARMDVQVSDRPLLALEQFAMGGHSTVRGYVENTLVRDNGVIGSLELRVPVLVRRSGMPIVELVPFFDAGYSWQAGRSTFGPTTLLSLGLGLRWSITDWLRFRVDWGGRLNDIPNFGTWNLQQEGLHIALTADWR